MNTQNAPAAERVRDGAAFLDRILPGWFNLIDLDRLDMMRNSRCVLGQLYCQSALGPRRRGGEENFDRQMEYFDLTSRAGRRLGFVTRVGKGEDDEHSVYLLENAWEGAILSRRRMASVESRPIEPVTVVPPAVLV